MKIWYLLLILFSALFFSCSENDSPTQNIPGGYVGFKFKMKNETGTSTDFIAITSNSTIIQKTREQLQLEYSQRDLHISGAIDRGNDGYNMNWSWHFKRSEWDLVQISVEVCDGNPNYVEEHIEDYLSIGYCPWGAVVIEELK
ncbi:MAG: hypothetical protein AB1521_16115 [Bacteroidota bacterium]